jgi:oxygen-dependent protoporphyrinogen oxidase
MGALVTTLANELTRRGVDIRLGARIDHLARQPEGWTVGGPTQSVDATSVVLAVPAPLTAMLLRPHDDEAAALLDAIDSASVMLITFSAAVDDVPDSLYGTGFLVPRHSAGKGRDPWVVTACTYLDRKWPHLAREGEVLLRASLGRIDDLRPYEWDDSAAAERAWEELGGLLGVTGAPKEVAVTRWPGAFPQYRVHHLLRTAGVEAAVERLGGLAVAGAAYHGVGIPACIASGRSAARSLL